MEHQEEKEKQLAARRSLDFVRNGMVVGLGSGTTVAHLIRMLGERVRTGLKIRGVPTSIKSGQLAVQVGIPLISLEDTTHLDLTIDGADEVDPRLRLIKGGGGALLHEKIVASASDQVIIIADSRKLVPWLGAVPLPLEVSRFGWPVVAERIGHLGGHPALRRDGAGNIVLSDEGNYILDCRFGPIHDPESLAEDLNRIPGLFEHGLFIGLTHCLIVGKGDQVEVTERPPA